MSDLIIFIVGVFIFGLTVYGAVVGGGLAMHVQHMRENPEIDRRSKSRRASKAPFDDVEEPSLREAA